MSAVAEPLGSPVPERRRLPKLKWPWMQTLILALGVFAVLSLVRVVTGADDLTSSGTFGAAVRLAVPIGLAALGGLYTERAGIVNIGLEGMMIMGTWFGAWAGWQWGPWAGVAIGILGGMLAGLLHALATVTFGVDHVVSGVAINILALGVTRYPRDSGVHRPGGCVGHALTADQWRRRRVHLSLPVGRAAVRLGHA